MTIIIEGILSFCLNPPLGKVSSSKDLLPKLTDLITISLTCTVTNCLRPCLVPTEAPPFRTSGLEVENDESHFVVDRNRCQHIVHRESLLFAFARLALLTTLGLCLTFFRNKDLINF